MVKKWLVGLGNPGDKYRHTRHNAGFMAVMEYASKACADAWRDKNQSAYLKWPTPEGQVFAVLPQTFMNDSGSSLLRWKSSEGLDPSQILVVYDDMDLPFGKLRYRAEGSGGSHNGMASIIQCLGSEKFPRLRIGIGKPEDPADWPDYVLRRFSPDEAAQLPAVLAKAALAMGDWVAGLGAEALMSKYNA
jgi:PTH1 family peptidyl-tRNA hydrolase